MLVILTTLMLLMAQPTYADVPSLEDIYTNPEHQRLPEVVILHQNEKYCKNCRKTVNMIINVLKENYRHKLHAYMVDIDKHPEYSATFKAHAPVTLVVIRISDGTAFGYDKLVGLQSETGDVSAFNCRVTEFINNFLGWN